MLNKKGFKCFGLLFLLSIIFGTSLNASSDVNALSHKFTSLPLYNFHPIVGNSGTESSLNLINDPYFSIYFKNGYVPSFDISITEAPRFFSPVFSSDSCVFDSGSNTYDYNGVWYFDGNQITNSLFDVYSDSVPSISSSLCRRLVPFGQDSSSSFNWNSIVLVTNPSGATSLKHLNPYFFEYSSYVLRGSENIDGFVYDSHGFTFDDLIGTENVKQIKAPYRLTFPIGVLSDFQSSDMISVSSGDSLNFKFSIFLDSDSAIDTSTISSSSAKLISKGYTSSGIKSVETTCSVSIDPLDQFGLNVDFSCDFVSSYDYIDNLIGFDFVWEGGSNDYLFNAPSGLNVFGLESGFSHFTLITNYDESPGGDIGSTNTGSSPSSAPGSPGYNIVDSEPNWISSLSNLFNFGFFNPFAPIFQMFSDNNSCASIPTIAGMLHSNETQVCPWFDSSTRNIVTPILGLSSMMLVFGFAVRWLGSSSGNLFEDSQNEEVSNQGGRWGHFKKGGS